jgi:hypothetical protein
MDERKNPFRFSIDLHEGNVPHEPGQHYGQLNKLLGALRETAAGYTSADIDVVIGSPNACAGAAAVDAVARLYGVACLRIKQDSGPVNFKFGDRVWAMQWLSRISDFPRFKREVEDKHEEDRRERGAMEDLWKAESLRPDTTALWTQHLVRLHLMTTATLRMNHIQLVLSLLDRSGAAPHSRSCACFYEYTGPDKALVLGVQLGDGALDYVEMRV